MKATIKTVDIKDAKIILREIQPENIMVTNRCVMNIDGSTTNTGISILRESDGALYYTMGCAREKSETPVQYKVRLKRFVYDILLRNPNIETVYYEEPFIGFVEAAKNLLMLRTFIEELIVEYEPVFNYVKHAEINNLKWKSLFLHPDKVPQGTELQKKAVREKLLQYLPFLAEVTEDEHDSIAMGFVACTQISQGLQAELESKKKAKAFQYNIVFAAAEEDDDILQEFHDIYNGPSIILQNGIIFTEIAGKANFDKHIYQTMGGDDKILIIKFSSNHHGNLILQHRIGHLAATYPYIYAIVWRKNRKS